ncbi:MAG: hypothetical protein HC860_21615 [Alkalinema sp. RU_4_3]|nr:hypothetical protein [Alkalinema sp. RU_4_3]
MDHTTTPIVVAAATVAMTLEMMKLKVAYNQRRGYVEEAKALAKTTIRQYLNKKKDQFNTYWNKSTAVVKGPYVYPFAVPYNEATITFPDGSKEVARRNYRTPTEAAQGKAAYQNDTNALLATPEFAGATDAQKQELAEAYLIQAIQIEATVEAARSNPALT